jgi:hypothetical protein
MEADQGAEMPFKPTGRGDPEPIEARVTRVRAVWRAR